MPAKFSTHQKMTTTDVHKRLRCIKRMLLKTDKASKNSQVLFNVHDFYLLDVEIVDEVEFYLMSEEKRKFPDQLFFDVISGCSDLFDRNKFKGVDVLSYVQEYKKKLCCNFAISSMMFTKYGDSEKIEKRVVICNGSVYHSPRIFYRLESSKQVVYEKAVDYLDLY